MLIFFLLLHLYYIIYDQIGMGIEDNGTHKIKDDRPFKTVTILLNVCQVNYLLLCLIRIGLTGGKLKIFARMKIEW